MKTNKFMKYFNGRLFLVIILIFYKSVTGQADPSDLYPQGDLMDDVSYFTFDGSLRHGSCYELIRGSNQYITWSTRGSYYLQADRWCSTSITSDPVGLGPPYILPPFPRNPYTGTTASTSLVLLYSNALPSQSNAVVSYNYEDELSLIDGATYQLSFSWAVPLYGIVPIDLVGKYFNVNVYNAPDKMIHESYLTASTGGWEHVVTDRFTYRYFENYPPYFKFELKGPEQVESSTAVVSIVNVVLVQVPP